MMTGEANVRTNPPTERPIGMIFGLLRACSTHHNQGPKDLHCKKQPVCPANDSFPFGIL